MSSVTVTTPVELKRAIKEKRDQIILTGKLAKQVKKAKKIKKLSPAVLAVVGTLGTIATAGVVVAPVTGGSSLAFTAAAAVPAAAASGLSVSVLIVITSVGLVGMSILFDDYTHLEFESGKIIFERKHKKRNISES